MEKLAINVEHITKIYHLYKKPRDRMKEAFSFGRKKVYHEDFHALDDISFNVKEGECYGIIGKNGSGKSTLLKIITGVLNQTSGNMEIEGRISALLELGAGFNQEYTGIENLYLNGNVMGYSREEMDKLIPEILDFADIGDYVYQPVKTYSSGMFVRLAFAMAINIEPEILIVDEALSVGDAFFQLKCYKKFMDFKKAGKTILFVTHDLGSVIKYCDRVMVLNDGKKIEEGKPREMVDVYKKLLVDMEDQKSGVAGELLNETHQLGIESNVRLTKKITEYGTKEAEIVAIAVNDIEKKPTTTINKFDTIEISFKVRFHKEVVDPIFAFTIKDIKGTELCGTNNMYEELEGFHAKEGEEYLASFTQSIPLQSGSFFISFGCTGLDAKGNFTVYHRLYDVIELNVTSSKNTVGYFDLDSKLDIHLVNEV